MATGYLPTDGSRWLNYVSGTTISGLPNPMTENGWLFKDRSTSNKTIWRFLKPLENGRYDEIRLNNHGNERTHYHIKKMIKLEDMPTMEEFKRSIAPELKKRLKKH